MSFATAISPYLRLMRLHQRAGIYLLLWPCWWSVALASPGWPSLKILALFAAGAVCMRSAGCILNDIADRKFDALVERTKNRPLASGELNLTQAIILLIVLLAASLQIAITLGYAVLLWAILALVPVALYPWMKRISWWPQLFLGLTFNWGVLMGWVAVRGTIEWPAIALYIGCIFWTLGYDTIYAHQDKKDDARIGVKSSALRLGERTKPIVEIFYALAAIGWAGSAYLTGCRSVAYIFLILSFLHLMCQIKKVDLESPESCKKVFISNILLGWLVLAAFLAGHINQVY